MTDKVQKIKEWVKTRKLCTMDEHMKFYCKEAELDYNLLCSIEEVLDSLQKEPVSDDLEEAIGEYCSNPENFITYIDVGFKQSPIKNDDIPLIIKAIKFGANWQKEQIEEALLLEVLPCFMHGGEADEVVAKLDEVLNEKK